MCCLRHATIAAFLLLLGGCSFFDLWNEAEAPVESPKIESRAPGGPVAGARLAVSPRYQSDQGMAPGKIEKIKGFAGNRFRRPAVVIQAPPVERRRIVKDLSPQRWGLDLQPIPASIELGSPSLADLISDRDWRVRTSKMLDLLFQ